MVESLDDFRYGPNRKVSRGRILVVCDIRNCRLGTLARHMLDMFETGKSAHPTDKLKCRGLLVLGQALRLGSRIGQTNQPQN